jgi:hypothetical protein
LIERGFVYGFEERLRCESLVSCKDKGFVKRRNHDANEKNPPQLCGMRLPRLLPDNSYSATNCLEHRAGTVNGLVDTCGHDL